MTEFSAIILIDSEIGNTIAPTPTSHAIVCDRPSNTLATDSAIALWNLAIAGRSIRKIASKRKSKRK